MIKSSAHDIRADPVHPVKPKICQECGAETRGYGKNRIFFHTHAAKLEKRLRERFPGTYLESNRDLTEETKRRRHEAQERDADRKAGVMMRDRYGRAWP